MKFGLSPETIDKIISSLSKFPQIDKALVFGSRSKGNYKNGSDIDICLFGDIDLGLMLRIETELDELMLPYKFDLAVYSSIQNADLKDHINRVGQDIYKSS